MSTEPEHPPPAPPITEPLMPAPPGDTPPPHPVLPQPVPPPSEQATT